MVPLSVLFGTAPMTVSTFWPSLKIITVGIERIPYSVATLGDSSVLSFTYIVENQSIASIVSLSRPRSSRRLSSSSRVRRRRRAVVVRTALSFP